jgi:hypothetical protein
MTEKEKILNNAIRANCGAWFATYGRIWGMDRKDGLLKPKLNYLQRKIQQVVNKFDDLKMPRRIIGLKPRNRGSTTFFTALGYTEMRRQSTSAVFIGGQSDQTVGLWNMMKTYKENDEFEWGNSGEVNAKGATFSNGSRAKKETAKDVQAGIGDTYQLLHATEAARWAEYGVANAAEVMNNILKAIPLLPGTSIFLESSAEKAGGDYYGRWLRAVDAEDFLSGKKEIEFGSYCRVFAPWFEFVESAFRLTPEQKRHIENTIDADPEYLGEQRLIDDYAVRDDQGVLHLGSSVPEFDAWEALAWRRYAIREICDRRIEIFDRDYPHSWQDAFLKSGAMRFNASGIKTMKKRMEGHPAMPGIIEEKDRRVAFRNTDKNEAKVILYEKPVPGAKYILAIDPMTGASQTTGEDPDYHGAFVLRAGFWNNAGVWIRPATAARIIACRWEIDVLAENAWRMARYYGSASGCMIAIEMNMDRGLTELLKLKGANLYMREVFNQREHKTSNAYGYQTNIKTREILITTLAAAIREYDTPGHGIDIWDERALEQCENFIDKDGRSEAGPGFHDDDTFAIALAFELIDHASVYVPERNVFGPPSDDGTPRGTAVAGAYS